MKPIYLLSVLALVVVLAVSLFLIMPILKFPSGETGIYRSFSSATVSPGDVLTINLGVIVAGDEDHYLVEEYVPEGWVVKIGDSTSEERRLTFYTLQDAESKTYIYSAMAPEQPGSYKFQGIYMFQGMTEPADIAGQTTVTVV